MTASTKIILNLWIAVLTLAGLLCGTIAFTVPRAATAIADRNDEQYGRIERAIKKLRVERPITTSLKSRNVAKVSDARNDGRIDRRVNDRKPVQARQAVEEPVSNNLPFREEKATHVRDQLGLEPPKAGSPGIEKLLEPISPKALNEDPIVKTLQLVPKRKTKSSSINKTSGSNIDRLLDGPGSKRKRRPSEKTKRESVPKLGITEITKHKYTVGYGKGTGAGFLGGDKNAKVRFIRLEYDGGDWDLGMGVGGDMNLLNEFGKIPGYKNRIAKKTESIRISTLVRKYKASSSPPLLFITGQGRFSIPKRDQRLLREYLLQRHGMIFASAGSAQFDKSFKSLMHELFPKVREVNVPLNDSIHKSPYQIPFFPYVAPHGGKHAIGWKVDGRWVAYYHPGDIVDAWRNDHAGVPRNVWISCYQLGMNVIFYAYRQNAIWLASKRTRIPSK